MVTCKRVLALVESYYHKLNKVVIHDKAHDQIYICLGSYKKNKDGHTVSFKDCARARIKFNQKSYSGELDERARFDLRFITKEKHSEMPTTFYVGERVKLKRR